MNAQIREYLSLLPKPNNKNFNQVVQQHPVLSELKEMFKEKEIGYDDAVYYGLIALVSENNTLKTSLIQNATKETKRGKQPARFMGF